MRPARIIHVDMEVEETRPIGQESVQVSGYVGDYRVILYLAKSDPRVAQLRTLQS